METLEEVFKNWDIDSVVDQTEPGKELLKIPTLHNKYLKVLIKHKLSLKRLNFEYSKLRKLKEEYYNGSLSQEELEEHNWQPFLLNIRTKSGLEKYIESDSDLIKIQSRRILHEEIIFACESILQELKSRTFQLRDFISWEKFVSGS